ncbi:tetratricopeptide repeat protein [Pseudoruegeria aquimaris]|nr:tetratricopeptide repeat protein [Pseudoruegeria aquimaris]
MARQICEAAAAGDSDAHAVEGQALRTLAWQAKWLGRFREAEGHCLEAERRLAPDGASAALVDVYSIHCVIAYSRNDFASAREFIESAARMLDEDMPLETRLDVMASEALLMRHTGKPGDALRRINEALTLASGPEAARLAHNRARLLNQLGEKANAFDAGREAVQLARTHRNRVVFPYACEVMGQACRANGQLDAAADILREGLECAHEDGDLRAVCQIHEQQAMVALDRGDAEAALALLRDGLLISEQINYPLWRRNFLRKLAEEYERRGDAEEALAAYRSLLALLDRSTR